MFKGFQLPNFFVGPENEPLKCTHIYRAIYALEEKTKTKTSNEL